MTRFLVAAIAGLALLGLAAFLWQQIRRGPPPPQPAPTVPASTPATLSGIALPPRPGPVEPPEPLEPPSAPPAPASTLPPDHPARVEADAIALNLRHFGQRFGGSPVGTNAEIVSYLNGGNPQGVRYIPQERLRLNEQGEVVDSWGTPYFFHQLSARETEIRSAGPDRKMWTPDDVLAK